MPPSDKDRPDKDHPDKDLPVKNKGPSNKQQPSPSENIAPAQKEKKDYSDNKPPLDLPEIVLQNRDPVNVKGTITDQSSVIEGQVALQYLETQIQQLNKKLESAEKLAKINSQYDQLVFNIQEEIEMLNRVVTATRVPPLSNALLNVLEPKKLR